MPVDLALPFTGVQPIETQHGTVSVCSNITEHTVCVCQQGNCQINVFAL